MSKKSKLSGKARAGIVLAAIVAVAIVVAVLLTAPWKNTKPDSSADRSTEELRPAASRSSPAAPPSPPVVNPLPDGSENYVATDPVSDEGTEYRNDNVFIYQYKEGGHTIPWGIEVE